MNKILLETVAVLKGGITMKNILLETAVMNIVVESECGDIRTKDQV
jgi:hypothetical protein